MATAKPIDLGLTGYEELFAAAAVRASPRIYDIPLAQIDDFPDHPYRVRLDEDMDRLVESIRERGIITPVMLRCKQDGRYEMVSGHRRKKACELLGLKTISAEIRELTRDEAIILMVESNWQRSKILPSEKAHSYKMRLEAIKRQGYRSDLANVPVAQRTTAREEVGEAAGESQDQVRRYIRLTQLIAPLLDMVDEGKLGFRAAVELSYLRQEEQEALLETMSAEQLVPTLAQAIQMKRLSQQGRLDANEILSILCDEQPIQKERISLRVDRLRQLIPANVPLDEIEDYVLQALVHYRRFMGQGGNEV